MKKDFILLICYGIIILLVFIAQKVSSSSGVFYHQSNISIVTSQENNTSLRKSMTIKQRKCCNLGIQQASKKICNLTYTLSKLATLLKGSVIGNTDYMRIDLRTLAVFEKLFFSLRKCKKDGRDVIYQRCCVRPNLR